MKNKYFQIYFVIIAIILIIAAVLYAQLPKKMDWEPTFEKNRETPFGAKLVYQNLQSIFSKSKIIPVNQRIYKQFDDKKISNTNYIFICKRFDLDDLDMRTLLNYVSQGNNVFISTEDLNYNLQDTLGFYYNIDMRMSVFKKNDVNAKAEYSHTFVNPHFGKNNIYKFKNMVFPSEISIVDTFAFKVLAVDNQKRPVFISTHYGNGNLYLHAYPYGLSNYYLLYKNNDAYISKCLSVLPNSTTYWDEYYKRDHKNEVASISPIKFILSTPSLKWAWFLLLISTLIYVLFRVKRQQRIMPVIKPFENSSLKFIKTIGRLYFNKGDHQDIVKKQISYWFEFIRSRLFISTATLDKHFVHAVSEKSGIELHKIEDIVYAISDMKNGHASKKDVISLYRKLEYFYTNSKR